MTQLLSNEEESSDSKSTPGGPQKWTGFLKVLAELVAAVTLIVQEVKPALQSILWQRQNLCTKCGAAKDAEQAAQQAQAEREGQIA